MIRVPFGLIPRNLFASPLVALRSVLTILSLAVAIFLLCILESLVASLNAGVEASAGNRLVVQSAVSLFVDLPLSYQTKIATVEGVDTITKFQWFGGYYKERGNFFAQFGVDADEFMEIYPEVEVVQGSVEAWKQQRIGCLIGPKLQEQYGWGVGDKIPMIGTIFAKPTEWEFEVAGIYRSKSANVDNATLFFHFKYLEESLESGEARGPQGAGTYVLRLEPGTQPEAVMRRVDELFENGPQRVTTTTEAEFQRQFVSMIGSVPTFLASIGSGVLFAIVLAVLNTMLMAGRERTSELGILKALGFNDSVAFLLLMLEAVLLCGTGGALGIGLALLLEPGFVSFLGQMFPGFEIGQDTLLMAAALSLGIGLLSGFVPAWRASRLKCVEALRAEA